MAKTTAFQGAPPPSNRDGTGGPRFVPSDPDVWAIPSDEPELASVHTLFSATLGICKVCSWNGRADGRARQEHLEQHRWQISPEGQRAYRRLMEREERGASYLAPDGSLLLHRRLGCLLWRLSDAGRSDAQIARDLQLPLSLVARALAIPERQWEAVQHLHQQGFLAAEIAERLDIPFKAADRQLRENADWEFWLEACCPPKWRKRPLIAGPGARGPTPP